MNSEEKTVRAVQIGAETVRASIRPRSLRPISMIGEVGLSEPSAFSTVMANALAMTPSGMGWSIIMALPCSSGLKTPAGIGAPFMGIIHSS